MATVKPGAGRENERLENRKEQEGRITDKLRESPHYQREQERKAAMSNGSGNVGDRGWNKEGYDWDKMPDSWAKEIYDQEGRDARAEMPNHNIYRPELDQWRSQKEGLYNASGSNLDRMLRGGEITQEQYDRTKNGPGYDPALESGGPRPRPSGPPNPSQLGHGQPPGGNTPQPSPTGPAPFDPSQWDPDDRSDGFRRRRKEARDWRQGGGQPSPDGPGLGPGGLQPTGGQYEEPDWGSVFGQQGGQGGYNPQIQQLQQMMSQMQGSPFQSMMGGYGMGGQTPQWQQMGGGGMQGLMQMLGGGQQYGQQSFGQQQAPNPFAGMGMRGGMY
jgi:hypothetical protein